MRYHSYVGGGKKDAKTFVSGMPKGNSRQHCFAERVGVAG